MAFTEFLGVMPEDHFGQSAALGLACVVLVWVLMKQFKRNPKLPPGPTPLPIIGNIHQLGKLPHRSLYDLSKKYGPVMYLRLGSLPCVVVSSSAMAKEFLTTHDIAFANRPSTAVGKYVSYNNKNLGLAPYGPYWKQLRKVCVMELLSAKRVDSFRSLRAEEISLAMKSIWEKSKRGTVAVNVSNCMTDMNSGIIWRILTGTRFFVEDESGNGGEIRLMGREIFNAVSAVNIGDLFPSIEWMDLQGLRKRTIHAHKYFDRIVNRIIEQHIEQKRRALVKKEELSKDILDVLLDVEESQPWDVEFDKDHIKAVIFDLFMAGTETTSTSMEWAMTALLKHPRVAKKLQEEVDSIVGKDRMVTESDLSKMHYLQCVIKESLRLYLPGPFLFPHENSEPVIAGAEGYVIPKNTKLLVNAWAIARDPTVWKDPEEFKPERFDGIKNFDYQGQDFDMLPFGRGRRICPGIYMGVGQLSLLLAQFWHCFDWRVEGDPADLDMEEEIGATVSRKHHLYAIPSLRLTTTL